MLLAPLLLAAAASAASFKDQVRATRFLKINLHAHTDDHPSRSYDLGRGDGDAGPAEVVSWYAQKGYAFTAITDHNELTTADAALPGIELTSSWGPHKQPIHVGAVCVDKEARGFYKLGPEGPGAVLQKTIQAAAAAGAKLIVVNHPAWEHGVDKAMLLSASGYNAVEIASGHPAVERQNAAAPESAEALWEAALAAGRDVRAVAADDAHDYHGVNQPREPDLRAPGRAWVEAWAEGGSREAVCEALGAGRFYATTGPELRLLYVEGNELGLEVGGNWNEASDKIEFLARPSGAGERVLAVSRKPSASYRAAGGEGYVRARVTQAGRKAWTQAYRVQ